MESWSRLAPFDAGWTGIEYVYLLRGVRLPTADRLRHAAGLLHEDGGVLDRHYDQVGGRLRPVLPDELPGRLDDLVRTSAVAGADVASAVALTGSSLGALPLRVVLGPDWVGFRFTHAFADGWSALHLMSHLLRQAETAERLPVPWRTLSWAQQQRVSVVGLARHPVTLLTAARRRAEFRGGDYAPAPEGEAKPPTREVLVSDEDYRDRLAAYRTRNHPGASLAAVLLDRLRTSLAESGRPPEPGVEVLFDVRRELGDDDAAFGNFIAPITVRPVDDDDPISVTDCLRRTQTSALPLVAAVGGRLRANPFGRRDAEPQRMVRVPTAQPRLSVSYLSRHSPLGLLPWADGETPWLGAITTPNGEGSIGVTAHEIGGGLSLSLSWYDGHVDGDLVRAAARSALALA